MRKILLTLLALASAMGFQQAVAQEVDALVADTAALAMEGETVLDKAAFRSVVVTDEDETKVPSGSLKLYEPPKAPDFNFIKSRTNPNVKPYKFLDDQTWVGIPVFAAGLIAKAEKTAFRQDYNNPNTKIRLIKYNFHSEIDNYTQYLPLALTIGMKIGGVESRSDWPRFWASSAASAAIMAGLVNGVSRCHYSSQGIWIDTFAMVLGGGLHPCHRNRCDACAQQPSLD